MPRRELKHGHQIEDWLIELSRHLTHPARMILIGSGALLWHAFQRGITEPLPENSMDVDPIRDSDEVARLCYDALIGRPGSNPGAAVIGQWQLEPPTT
jgi:hypothetical protein